MKQPEGIPLEQTKSIIVAELAKKISPKINRTILGIFLIFCILTVVMRLVLSTMYDTGFHDGEFHIGYWSKTDYSFEPQFKQWLKTAPKNANSFQDFVNAMPQVQVFVYRRPAFFWWLTQFTWMTTLIIIVFLTFRFFGMSDRVPKWLNWIMSQRMLSQVAMWDIVVAVVFWAALSRNFASGFNESLVIPEYISTTLVHGFIPLGILTYSLIYLLRDKKASMLREFFAIRGLIFPILYAAFYTLLTIIWYDPYNITHMHDKLLSEGWSGWISELWKIPAALLAIYGFLGLLTVFHNIILNRFNKNYDRENDYEALKRKRTKINKLRKKIIRKQIEVRTKKIAEKK